jgi:CRISPR-associated protein Cas2
MRRYAIDRFELLICYDVETTSAEGRKRLRQVAKVCERHGQRVQKSVFECKLSEQIWGQMRSQLEEIIDVDHDSLRIYQLPPDRARAVEVMGKDGYTDFGQTLTV